MSSERLYARHVLPRGIARGLLETVQGDLTGAWRSFAIAFGLYLAAIGFLVGRSTTYFRPRPTLGELPAPDREGLIT